MAFQSTASPFGDGFHFGQDIPSLTHNPSPIDPDDNNDDDDVILLFRTSSVCWCYWAV